MTEGHERQRGERDVNKHKGRERVKHGKGEDSGHRLVGRGVVAFPEKGGFQAQNLPKESIATLRDIAYRNERQGGGSEKANGLGTVRKLPWIGSQGRFQEMPEKGA